jgi:hypothetical protein
MKTQEQAGDFLGTYFSKDTVLRLASVAKILSWAVVISTRLS